jgi:uncharacterized NAD(P)/FAD-binding protein YdhS
MPVICIVGGGFSGVAVAWQLLHTLQLPAQIVIVSKEKLLGRGLAYGTVSPHHLLNVPAGRMGISPGDEAGFLRYLQQQGLPYASGDFVPRSLYSAYLVHALGEAIAVGAARGITLEVQHASVTAIAAQPQGGYAIQLDTGAKLHAQMAVMALGNFDPKLPLTQSELTWTEPGLYATAWDPRGLQTVDTHKDVLLVGSGLTAFDALLELRHLGHQGRVTMLSRRGLLAQTHRVHETPPPQGVVDFGRLLSLASARAMLREVRTLARTAQGSGHDWRDVLGGMRASTPRLWKQLPEQERRRFLRHLAPYWDTHRHRASVPIGNTIAQELQADSLQLVAGRLGVLEPAGNAWRATIQPRGGRAAYTQEFTAVVNCTGPSSDLSATKAPLIQSLMQRGHLCQDPLRLGVQVDDQMQLLDSNGAGQPDLYYIGPLLKADLWEATAVPELRVHASQLAATIRKRV